MGSRKLPVFVLIAGLLPFGSASATELASYLPAGTCGVISVNVKQLRHTPIFETHAAAPLRKLLEQDSELTKLLEQIGLDLFHDIDRVTIAGVPDEHSKEPDDVSISTIIHGRFDVSKIRAVVGQLAQEHPDRLKIHGEKGQRIYEVIGSGKQNSFTFDAGARTTDSGEPSTNLSLKSTGSVIESFGTQFVAILSNKTVFVSSCREAVEQALKQAGGEPPAAIDPRGQKLIASISSNQCISVASWAKAAGALANAGKQGDKGEICFSTLVGGVTIDDGIRAHFVLEAMDDKGAKLIETTLGDLRPRADGLALLLAGNTPELACLKELPRCFCATCDGKTVTADLVLGGTLLDRVILAFAEASGEKE